MYFSLGNYFWLMLNRLEHSKLIPGLKSESKIFLCNFHNIFLLSKIAHLKICPFLPVSRLVSKAQKLHQAKIYVFVLQTTTSLPPYPVSDSSSISVLVKALFMVKERLDSIWLEIQEHTNFNLPKGTPRQKTHKVK